MKKNLPVLFVFFFFTLLSKAQITTPVIKANFGVDADLRSNFFNGLVQSGNDDWFKLPATTGGGQFIIDTAGAAALLSNYTANPLSRRLPFYKNMRFPAYSVVNNRLLVDAIFVRDYHGDDSTVFAAGSNKNGMSPFDWSCPVSQSIPDKNEILDIMLHVRRAGPNVTDSLWLMGGISIENTTGNRYFDFEMYQTNIFYNRTTRSFHNYGPDAGHTSWKLDAAGNMTAPGDIILTAEYSSSSLTAIEARIWINKNDLLKTPVGFNWTGSFDGASAGSQFGYAGIQPKAAGAFYTGLQSVNNTWAGPFSLVLGDNSVLTNYTARQYMEFSVNLSKLGLDQSQIFGGDDCAMPFRRLMVKTRASTSFTSELKDFVAPFDFFVAPAAKLETQTPNICDDGSISGVYVMNPIPTSLYQWSTIGGQIIGSNTGPSIVINKPGTYIVQQLLQSGCSIYAADTITVGSLGNCGVLSDNLIEFKSVLNNNTVQLNWKVKENQLVRNFELERSTDGVHFSTIYRIDEKLEKTGAANYFYSDDVSGIGTQDVYYRVKVNQVSNKQQLSNITKQQLAGVKKGIRISPNPVKDNMQVQLYSLTDGKAVLYIYDPMGRVISTVKLLVQKGNNTLYLDILKDKPAGIYRAAVSSGDKIVTERILVIR
jgi:hypothetical protein